MAESAAAEKKSPEEHADGGNIVVVDLGKKKRKNVKKLRKGKGKLMRTVHEVVAELQAEATAEEGDTVVVIVERKQKDLKFPLRW